MIKELKSNLLGRMSTTYVTFVNLASFAMYAARAMTSCRSGCSIWLSNGRHFEWLCSSEVRWVTVKVFEKLDRGKLGLEIGVQTVDLG